MAKKHKMRTAADKEKARVFCVCGGEVVNVTALENGKMRHFSRCTKCGARERFLSTFREKAVFKG